MLEQIQAYAESVPPAIQALVVAGIGAVPFLESHSGAAVGVLAGMPVGIAVAAAVVGNLVVTGLLVFGVGRVRERVMRDRAAPSPRQLRTKRLVERFGVPGVGVFGQMLVPNQISGPAMVSFGISPTKVLIWQSVGMVVWALVFGVLASLGVNIIIGR